MTRRANGEGDQPRLQGDGRWRARYTAADGSRKAVYSRISAADCRALRDKKIDDARDGILPVADRDKYTLERWMTHWIDTWIDDSEHDPRTVKNYRANAVHHLAPIHTKRIGNEKGDLSATDIQLMLKVMERAGKSGTTRQIVFDQLKAGLERARLDRLIRENPAEQVKRPRRDTVETVAWSEEELNLFLDSIVGDRLEAAFNIITLCGLRQGEVVGLRWIDIRPGTIHVAGQLDRFTHLHKKRKGRAKGYDVALPDVVADLLDARRVAQKREQLKAGARWTGNPQGLVFTTRYGTPVPHNNIGNAWRNRVAKVEGLPAIKFHGSRHTAASVQIERGASLAEVGGILGQSDRETTRMYVHFSERTQTAAAARMNQVRPRRSGTGG